MKLHIQPNFHFGRNVLTSSAMEVLGIFLMTSKDFESGPRRTTSCILFCFTHHWLNHHLSSWGQNCYRHCKEEHSLISRSQVRFAMMVNRKIILWLVNWADLNLKLRRRIKSGISLYGLCSCFSYYSCISSERGVVKTCVLLTLVPSISAGRIFYI